MTKEMAVLSHLSALGALLLLQKPEDNEVEPITSQLGFHVYLVVKQFKYGS